MAPPWRPTPPTPTSRWISPATCRSGTASGPWSSGRSSRPRTGWARRTRSTTMAAAFGLDFGTNPVTGMTANHATLNPFTGGGFNDDSTNDLGINSSTDQWVHVAMVWNGTNVITYVN